MHPRPLDPRCRCGHPRDVHEHFRDGTDCGICGRAVCRAFRTTNGIGWALLAAWALLGRNRTR